MQEIGQAKIFLDHQPEIELAESKKSSLRKLYFIRKKIFDFYVNKLEMTLYILYGLIRYIFVFCILFLPKILDQTTQY